MTALPTLSVDPGRRVLLKPLSLAHIHTHFRWNNDPELNHLDSEVPFERESFGTFFRRFEAMVDRPPACTLDFEVHTSDGTLIGIAYADDLCAANRHARIGLTIGEKGYWRRGLGTAALQALLALLFERHGLHRVTAEVPGFNDGARCLFQRLGFTQEGRFRDHLYRDGRFWDKEVYGLLRSEFSASASAATWTLAAA